MNFDCHLVVDECSSDSDSLHHPVTRLAQCQAPII